MPIANDRRAWDAVVQLPLGRVAVEAETRVSDLQSVQRKIGLKLRDDPGVGSVILAIADTRWNRAVVREHHDAFRTSFPLERKALVSAMSAGRPPASNGMLLL